MNGLVMAVAVGVVAATPMLGQNGWNSDYGDALQRSRTELRPMIVVLEAGNQVAKPLHSLESTEQQLLKPFVLCRVDITTKYGQKVAEAFGAKTFPMTAVVDRKGRSVLFRKTGEFTPSQWVATLVKYQSGRQTQRVTTYKPAVSSGSPVLSNSSPFGPTLRIGQPTFGAPQCVT